MGSRKRFVVVVILGQPTNKFAGLNGECDRRSRWFCAGSVILLLVQMIHRREEGARPTSRTSNARECLDVAVEPLLVWQDDVAITNRCISDRTEIQRGVKSGGAPFPTHAAAQAEVSAKCHTTIQMAMTVIGNVQRAALSRKPDASSSKSTVITRIVDAHATSTSRTIVRAARGPQL
jgi:hypothetical protein